jgi:hypothetical protein
MDPFMAVTAHFVSEETTPWTLQARLIAFRNMPGSHNGQALGDTFVDILTKLRLDHKVGHITADNASNNRTMTEAIESALILRGIQFSHSKVYVQFVPFSVICVKLTLHRCFPHVINLAVQDFLDAIKTLDNPYGISTDLHHH